MEKYKTGSRVNFYVTNVVVDLFDEFKQAISQRIEGLDFYYNWYHLVAFILFVMKIKHQKTDKSGKELLNKGIEFYIEDKTNMESYINYFGSSQLQTGLENYSQDTLANNVQALIGMYIDAWNKNIDSDPDIAASIVFANKLATDDDRRHITLGFRFLYNQFSVDGSNGTIKMFNCKK